MSSVYRAASLVTLRSEVTLACPTERGQCADPLEAPTAVEGWPCDSGAGRHGAARGADAGHVRCRQSSPSHPGAHQHSYPLHSPWPLQLLKQTAAPLQTRRRPRIAVGRMAPRPLGRRQSATNAQGSFLRTLCTPCTPCVLHKWVPANPEPTAAAPGGKAQWLRPALSRCPLTPCSSRRLQQATAYPSPHGRAKWRLVPLGSRRSAAPYSRAPTPRTCRPCGPTHAS